MGTQFTPKRDTAPPQFSAHVYVGQSYMHQDTTWYRGRPQPRRHCVSSISPKGAHPHPIFDPDVYCGQMAGWMKMPLGTEVDLGPGHIVLDGDKAPPPAKGAQQPPLFSAHVYCGHGRPSQLLLSSCCTAHSSVLEHVFSPNNCPFAWEI